MKKKFVAYVISINHGVIEPQDLWRLMVYMITVSMIDQ
jgi:hypothetical protein